MKFCGYFVQLFGGAPWLDMTTINVFRTEHRGEEDYRLEIATNPDGGLSVGTMIFDTREECAKAREELMTRVNDAKRTLAPRGSDFFEEKGWGGSREG